jgi:hypothetical protein
MFQPGAVTLHDVGFSNGHQIPMTTNFQGGVKRLYDVNYGMGQYYIWAHPYD